MPAGRTVLKQETTGSAQIDAFPRDSDAKYQAIVKAFDGLIYVCSRDYRIEFMNERFIKRTGYDPHGMLCYSFSEK
jgi:PAS domain-containing protein